MIPQPFNTPKRDQIAISCQPMRPFMKSVKNSIKSNKEQGLKYFFTDNEKNSPCVEIERNSQERVAMKRFPIKLQ